LAPTHRPLGLLPCVLALIAVSAAAAEEVAPTVRLVPTELVEEIRDTRAVAAQVETDVVHAVEDLDRQSRLLRASQCDPGVVDPGCDAIRDQVRRRYLEMLGGIEARLPGLERSVRRIERGLRERLGAGAASTREIQGRLARRRTHRDPSSRPRLRGASGASLSQKLGRLQSVMGSAGQAKTSVEALAADLYLDMRESLDLIAVLRDEIARTRILAETQLGASALTPEMEAVTADARVLIFGSEQGADRAPDRPTAVQPAAYRSPLEL
jgi:hypothetical protein